LYFSSDRTGAYGAADLYEVVKIIDSTWATPINLGPNINTQGNEFFPFVKRNDLVFNSNLAGRT
jgi:hypothetical protein